MVVVDCLGTGIPTLDPLRCGSGTAVSFDGSWLLVDCGRGVCQRVVEAGLDVGELKAVLLTHHHTDHISDLANLAIARWVSGTLDPLVVLAPEGPAARFARACLDAFPDQAFYSQGPADGGVRPDVDVQAFTATASPRRVFGVGSFDVSSVLVDHHPIEAAVGYRVEVGGVSIAISGDTAACPGFEELAREADLLIHEAVLADAVRPRLLEWNASAQSVGALARRAEVRRLVLTHLIPPPSSAEAEQRFVDDARRGGYTGVIEVARDLARFRISV